MPVTRGLVIFRESASSRAMQEGKSGVRLCVWFFTTRRLYLLSLPPPSALMDVSHVPCSVYIHTQRHTRTHDCVFPHVMRLPCILHIYVDWISFAN